VTTTRSQTPGETLRCARHPNTETVLRCGRCETPICPRCQIQTPVGARCPTCAQVKRTSLLLKPRELARAVAYGVGAAVAGTAAFALVPLLGILGPLIWFALVGFGVGDAVSRGANRRRARELAPIAVACLFVGYELAVVVLLTTSGRSLTPDVLLAPFRQLQFTVGLLVGALLAWMRTR
jgi:hypothetical protein